MKDSTASNMECPILQERMRLLVVYRRARNDLCLDIINIISLYVSYVSLHVIIISSI